MALLVRVDEIVCLQQDLVVDAADVRIGMVVRGQPRNAVHVRTRSGQLCEKRLYQRRAFQLLMLAVGVAVFLPAQRAGDVVDHRGKLQLLLRVSVQPLQLSDGLCHGPDLEKMVDVMAVALVEFDHFLNCG